MTTDAKSTGSMRSQQTTRSQQTAHTRTRIIDAARDVFVAHGYRASSLRDVAASAGISHPGLLKHFASKDLLLAALIERFDEANAEAFLEESESYAAGTLNYASVAARNETIPGYLPLFAALVGEGSAHGHPAHEWMRERYAGLREMSADALHDAIDHGVVDPERDPEDEAVRVAAVWDGLQLLELYLPERVDLVELLEEYQELLALPLAWDEEPVPARDERAPVPALEGLPPAEGAAGAAGAAQGEGYRVGRERRAQIVGDATDLFAREGYADTSLREIAERVGVSKSTLLHHYPSKEDLLGAVLDQRDRQLAARSSAHAAGAAEFLANLPSDAAANTQHAPGLIEVYAVLSCEALPEDHPAHAYFTRRFTWALDRFAAMFRAAQADGELPAHRDPEREAIRLVALWDGLQYQWLYDRTAVDVAAHLAAHLSDILPAR